jgi:hypothetical protein
MIVQLGMRASRQHSSRTVTVIVSSLSADLVLQANRQTVLTWHMHMLCESCTGEKLGVSGS